MNGVPITTNSVCVSKKTNHFLPSFCCLQLIAETGSTESAGSALANKLPVLPGRKQDKNKAIPRQLMLVYRMSPYPSTSAEHFQSILVIVLVVGAG